MSAKPRRSVDERTPLVSGQSATADSSHITHVFHSADDRSATYTFFLDTNYTSGTESDRVAIRALAHTWHVFKVTLLSSYINFLLVAVPIGIIAGEAGWGSTAVFVINFFAIIPLAAVLSFATEEISLKLGETLGGLLNATFGNAVELIVSIIALKQGQIEVVQSSMLGSILSNLLLVMGMCFLLGGIAHRGQTGNGTQQQFNDAYAQTTCSLMTLSSASLVIPAALYAVLDQNGSHEKASSVLVLSRGTAVLLLLLYALYLFFQLCTHSNLFDLTPETHPEEAGLRRSSTAAQRRASRNADGEPEEPRLNAPSAAALLVIVTVLVAVCADYLVSSIDDIVASANISKAFIGLILLPIVGNAAEHVTAVVVALRDKMNLAMGVAIGSSIQIALGVTPFLVIVGWIIGQPMTLHFETFETVTFASSVLVVTYIVQDGKSNYLEGAMLLALYIIIAVAFYAIPSGVLDKVTTLVRG